MARKGRGSTSHGSVPVRNDPQAFSEDLKRRGQAARGLEQELLTNVPLLYGSPGEMEANGDPGIAIARAHREDMLRRSGSPLRASGRRSEVTLPFERATAALALVLFLISLLLD